MGILSKAFGFERQSSNSSSLGAGNHSINRNSIINGGVMGRISPTNTPNWEGYQTAPAVQDARNFTQKEAQRLTQLRKQNAQITKATRTSYTELERIDKQDTRKARYRARYLKSNAKAGQQQARINAGVGRSLHSLRPGYARMNASLEKADNSAQQQIAALTQQLNQL
ncbi:MAG: hypothetical protein F6K24_02115 [Okeania sp. SIO2D1]|nr:hypothetical protein [Okeania sp. SIO2D1]